eukprot:SAG11_NODE_223_length_12120_cov_6.351884_4_plen_616_part_00
MTIAATECVACGPGLFAAASANRCSSCAVGRYSGASASLCTACSAGDFTTGSPLPASRRLEEDEDAVDDSSFDGSSFSGSDEGIELESDIDEPDPDPWSDSGLERATGCESCRIQGDAYFSTSSMPLFFNVSADGKCKECQPGSGLLHVYMCSDEIKAYCCDDDGSCEDEDAEWCCPDEEPVSCSNDGADGNPESPCSIAENPAMVDSAGFACRHCIAGEYGDGSACHRCPEGSAPYNPDNPASIVVARLAAQFEDTSLLGDSFDTAAAARSAAQELASAVQNASQCVPCTASAVTNQQYGDDVWGTHGHFSSHDNFPATAFCTRCEGGQLKRSAAFLGLDDVPVMFSQAGSIRPECSAIAPTAWHMQSETSTAPICADSKIDQIVEGETISSWSYLRNSPTSDEYHRYAVPPEDTVAFSMNWARNYNGGTSVRESPLAAVSVMDGLGPDCYQFSFADSELYDKCEPCEEGKVSRNGFVCEFCPDGSQPNNWIDDTDEIAGHYDPTVPATSCVACPAGKWVEVNDFDQTCKDCEPWEVAPLGSPCTSCPAGHEPEYNGNSTQLSVIYKCRCGLTSCIRSYQAFAVFHVKAESFLRARQARTTMPGKQCCHQGQLI